MSQCDVVLGRLRTYVLFRSSFTHAHSRLPNLRSNEDHTTLSFESQTITTARPGEFTTRLSYVCRKLSIAVNRTEDTRRQGSGPETCFPLGELLALGFYLWEIEASCGTLRPRPVP